MTKTYTFRLTAEGVTELQKQMQAAGDAGQQAFQKIIDTVPGLGSALDSAAKKAEAAHERLIASTKADFQTLQASLDPAIAAQQNFAKGRDVITAAQTAGVASDAEAARALQLLEQRFGSASGGVSGFASHLGSLKEIVGAFGISLSAVGLVSFGKSVFESSAQLVDQARQLGISTDALQAYRNALKDNGAEAEDAGVLISKLSQTLGAAESGSSQARAEFNKLGINWKDLAASANPVQAAVQAIAVAIGGIADPAQRAQAEMTFFGRSGREVGAALDDLSHNLDSLVGKYKEQGRLLDSELAEKAKSASDEMGQAFQRLQVQAAGPIVFLTDKLTILIDALNTLQKFGHIDLSHGFVNSALSIASMGLIGGDSSSGQADPLHPADRSPRYIMPPGSAGASTDNFDQYLAKAQQDAQLAGLSANERAREEAAIAAANALLKDGITATGKISDYSAGVVQNYKQALDVLGPTRAAEVQRAAALAQSGAYAQKLHETYALVLDQLKQEAVLAGETAQQRDVEVATIRAAQAVKERGDLERNLVQTYSQARAILGQQRADQVASVEAQRENNALQVSVLDPLRQEVSLAAVSRDTRAQELEILRLKTQYGATAVQQSEDELRALLKANDIQGVTDRIADLKEQVQLSGMLPEEAERYAAVLQEIHASHGNITQDQKNEIDSLIRARQEAEKMQNVVRGIQNQFQSFFEDVLEKGELNFGKLFRGIEAEFAQMLAQMAAQAIAQPIIIPMVQSLFGGGGGAGAAGALLGGGGAGALGDLGSLGSLISGGVNSLGASLGFGQTISLGNNLIGQPMSFTTPGSLFGSTTLGGFLGGTAIGSLAGSLLFGNKADSGIGSTVGGAIGSLFGPLGSVAGGLIGGLAGSLTGSSNQSSIANLINGGTNYALVQQGSQQNTGLVSQAAASITQAVAALSKSGVSLTNDISGFGIGSDKDYIYYTNGQKQKLGSKADPNDVINQVLNHLLSTASAGDSSIASVIGAYKGQGGINTSNLSQFLSDIGFSGSLKDIGATVQQLTQAEQQIKSINDQFQTTIDHAQQLGLDTSQIIQVRDAADRQVYQTALDALDALKPANDNASAWKQALDAIAAAEREATGAANALGYGLDQVKQSAADDYAALADNFNQQISDAILKIANPAMSDYNALISTQAQRMKDALAVGADLNQVYQLNNLEQQQLQQQQQAAADQARQQQQAAADQARQQAEADAAQKVSDAHDKLVTAYNAESSALGSTISKFNDFSSTLRSFAATLGGDLAGAGSPLSRYAVDKDSFMRTAAAAANLDPQALSALKDVATQFLADSKSVSASSRAYGADIAWVKSAVLSAASAAEGSAASSAAQLTALQSLVSSFGITNETVMSVADAVANLQAVTASAYAGIPGHASGLYRVPYDGYLMRAHQGEAVLPASEADAWRRGASNAELLAEMKEIRSLLQKVAGKDHPKQILDWLRRVSQDGTSVLTTAA